jgi:hypothetical protein
MIQVTPIAMSVHRKGMNPIFGEGVTHVIVEDEASGPFLILRQLGAKTSPGEIRIDLDELETVTRVARELVEAFPADQEGGRK